MHLQRNGLIEMNIDGAIYSFPLAVKTLQAISWLTSLNTSFFLSAPILHPPWFTCHVARLPIPLTALYSFFSPGDVWKNSSEILGSLL